LWSENQEREAVPIAGDEKREMQDARRPFPRRLEGK